MPDAALLESQAQYGPSAPWEKALSAVPYCVPRGDAALLGQLVTDAGMRKLACCISMFAKLHAAKVNHAMWKLVRSMSLRAQHCLIRCAHTSHWETTNGQSSAGAQGAPATSSLMSHYVVPDGALVKHFWSFWQLLQTSGWGTKQPQRQSSADPALGEMCLCCCIQCA